MRVSQPIRSRWRGRQHRPFLVSLLTVLAVVILAACGGGTPTATSGPAASAAPSSAASSAPRPSTAPSAAGSAAPSAAASAAASGTAARGTATAGTAGTPGAGGGGQLARPPEGACTAAAANKPVPSGRTRLVIGTGGTGGVFFPYGGGLAKVLTAKLPNTEVTAEATGGSVDNNKLVNKDPTYIGMTTADSGDEAVKGIGVYGDTGKIPLCTIAVLYDSFLHVVALDGQNINSLADLKGKRVSVGSPGSSTEVAANRLLEAAGLDPMKDIQRDTLSVQESVNAMKDQKIVAFFWIGGLPTAAVTELATTGPKVKFLPTVQYVQGLAAKYGPVYYPRELPANVYPNIASIPGIGVDNLLVVNANMPAQLVYDILKTLFDNQADVQAIHAEAKKFNLQSAALVSPVPFHPGAIRFFTEKGVYKP